MRRVAKNANGGTPRMQTTLQLLQSLADTKRITILYEDGKWSARIDRATQNADGTWKIINSHSGFVQTSGQAVGILAKQLRL